ncbi:MAG: T9SS type A sorting domain-containing protein [candidate division WOR-3 bacterium]|nr:MAG: T9SS type A sorting domain-containing protein [candidate division WOR-3 bacterium]
MKKLMVLLITLFIALYATQKTDFVHSVEKRTPNAENEIEVPVENLQLDTYLDSILLFENFESGMPLDWTVIDGNSDGVTWTTGTTPDLLTYTPPDYETAYAYYSDDDASSIAPIGTEYLISPAVGCEGIAVLMFSYSWGFRSYDIPFGATWARFYGGISWSNWYQLAIYHVDSAAVDTFNLGPYLPADSIQVQFTYEDSTGAWAWAFGIDNVELYAVPEVHDVGCISIASPPEGYVEPGDYDVIGRIQNYGNTIETFDAIARVYDSTSSGWTEIFAQTITLTDFPIGGDSLINFGMVTFEQFNFYYTEILTQLIGDEDPSNDTSSVYSRTVLFFGDIIFEMDVETPTGDNQCLGVEYDGNYFYVTGGNSGADPNYLYVLDTLGNLIWTIAQPVHSTLLGWRDLAWDGADAWYGRIDTLYASCNNNVDKFGIDLLNGTLDYYGSFPGPENPNRALGCKPDSAWFFTANWDDTCYKFSRTNPHIQGVDNTWVIYGAAYDTDPTEDWVWWHSQDDPGTGFSCQIEQMDAITMEFTGLNFGYKPTITTSGIAGGLCYHDMYAGWLDVLFALVQGNPDCIIGIYLRRLEGVNEIPKVNEPSVFGFMTNMPNPARGCAPISYTLTKPGNVLLKIYDSIGRLIKTLVNTYQSAGTKTVYWNGKGENHRIVPNGIYFLRLEAEDKVDTYKLILMK